MWVIAAAAILLAACGDSDDSVEIDAANGEVLDAATSGDAAGEGDASGGGLQFCGEEDDPDCADGMECCQDGVCRDDCGGGGGTISCDCSADCPTGGTICCETSVDTFCTRRAACENFGGVERDSCE